MYIDYIKYDVTCNVTLFLLFFKRICVVDTKSIFHSTSKTSWTEKGLTVRNSSNKLKRAILKSYIRSSFQFPCDHFDQSIFQFTSYTYTERERTSTSPKRYSTKDVSQLTLSNKHILRYHYVSRELLYQRYFNQVIPNRFTIMRASPPYNLIFAPVH